MSDEPSFDFLPWEELSVGVRRNRKKMYNYIVSVLNGGGPTPPGPTPTSTGTVTVTCQDESENKLGGVSIAICTELPPSQSTIVATGETDGTIDVGVATITDVPYGSYKLVAHDPNTELSYTGDLTVDGDEEVTITLTE